jgi:hypothetical protein
MQSFYVNVRLKFSTQLVVMFCYQPSSNQMLTFFKKLVYRRRSVRRFTIIHTLLLLLMSYIFFS